MPAYNPPPQTLFSPVSNYYQGKAIRQQLAAGEQEAELRQAELDSIPAQRQAAQRKAEIEENKEQRAQEKADREVAAGIADGKEKELEAVGEVFARYALSRNDGADPQDSFAQLRESLITAVGEEATAQAINEFDRDGNGFFGEDEELQIRAYATSIGTQLGGGSKTSVLSLEEKLAMGMQEDWARRSVVERDETGNVSVTSQPTGMTPEDVASNPLTDSQKGATYAANVEEFNTSSDVQELISSTLPQVIEMPDAVGVKGAIGVGGAGFLTTLGQDEMAEAFSQYMTGAPPEEVAQLQTQLQVLRGRIIPIVTGEQGKRLSETEREIASRAVGLIEGIKGPADLTKAYPQVMGAMRQLYAESWVRKFNIASRDDDIGYPYDLANADQRIELFTEFSDAGVDINTAKRTMIRLKSIQGAE